MFLSVKVAIPVESGYSFKEVDGSKNVTENVPENVTEAYVLCRMTKLTSSAGNTSFQVGRHGGRHAGGW